MSSSTPPPTCDCTQAQNYTLLSNPTCFVQCAIQQWSPQMQQAFNADLGNVRSALGASLQQLQTVLQQSNGLVTDDVTKAGVVLQAALSGAEDHLQHIVAHDTLIAVQAFSVELAVAALLLLALDALPVCAALPLYVRLTAVTAVALRVTSSSSWRAQLSPFVVPILVTALGIRVFMGCRRQ